ncbi:hypothetical protein HCH_05447 [Hahella chejuensis KCTC 2396]|uniref:Lipoprotein n=1 Tax=Hahella chejuensis (strain KCTC 2396) TaxID=349521 RepID=Q2SB62_HAHCH|nr:hypothetical protein [Hahella chejuensis]ABC32112.1 hypothetical protein HCH_05447 [Hahella chejuensis KCTC 2396]
MRPSHKAAATLLASLLLTGCDGLIDLAGEKFQKSYLIETCGEDDPACISAVEAQFDACHAKHKKHWDAYMAASEKEEDIQLERYSQGLYECIVDENGDPYFYYDPDA